MAEVTRPRRLGRGLTSLLSDNAEVPVDGAPGMVMVGVERIHPNKYQPRKGFDAESLGKLAESIRRSGLMQPIVVRRVGGVGDGYELVAGERRWRAARSAGLSVVPAVVRELSDEEAAEWALVENLQREDLNPMERAFAFRGLCERFGLSHADVAERVGQDRSTVANMIRLTELEAEIQEMIGAGALSPGHGRALLGVRPGAWRVEVAQQAASQGWNVRRLEEATRDGEARILPGPARAGVGRGGGGFPPATAEQMGRMSALADLERQLGEHLGTKVRVRPDARGKRGRLSIEFYTLDQFDGLLAKLGFQMK